MAGSGQVESFFCVFHNRVCLANPVRDGNGVVKALNLKLLFCNFMCPKCGIGCRLLHITPLNDAVGPRWFVGVCHENKGACVCRMPRMLREAESETNAWTN